MSKVIVIHASCDDLRFLQPINKKFSEWVGSALAWHYLNDRTTHDPAKDDLEQLRKGLVIILLHGRSDGFRAGDYGASYADDSPAMFLKKGQMGAFQGKAVFCLSCKGNEHAAEAIQKGARVFVGFDDVPFSRFDLATGAEIPLHSLTKHCQSLILSAVIVFLYRLIQRGETFNDAVSYLRLWVRRHAIEFVRQNILEQHRNDVAYLFLRMAETIRLSGDGSLRFSDLG